MNDNYLKEKANSIRNEMNHLWTAMLVTGGGAIGFAIFEYKNFLIYLFLVLGIIMTLLFVNAYINRRIELRNILVILKKEVV